MTALLTALLLALTPPRATPDSLEKRLQSSWPVISAISWLYREDPYTVAGILAQETRLTDVRGGWRNDHWGVGQVNWYFHGKMLRAEGIADFPQTLLYRPIGVWAAVRALAETRRVYRLRGDDLLCKYGGAEIVSREIEGRGCWYADAVNGWSKRARRVVND